MMEQIEQSNGAMEFEDVKEQAVKHVTTIVDELKAFKIAIEQENIAAIYQIYKGRLYRELKEIANEEHEIDNLLAKKIHDAFTQRYPFIVFNKKHSATDMVHQIGSYYHERPTILINVALPKISIVPTVRLEWERPSVEWSRGLKDIEQEMDCLTANVMLAKAEIKRINQEILQAENQKKLLEHKTKGFFLKAKSEEVKAIDTVIQQLKVEQEKWLPFVEDETNRQRKAELMVKYQAMKLKTARIQKELRLIHKHFGSLENLLSELEAFLRNFLHE